MVNGEVNIILSEWILCLLYEAVISWAALALISWMDAF